MRHASIELKSINWSIIGHTSKLPIAVTEQTMENVLFVSSVRIEGMPMELLYYPRQHQLDAFRRMRLAEVKIIRLRRKQVSVRRCNSEVEIVVICYA